MRKIKFIKSPLGTFKLAYGVGMEAEINEGQAAVLVDAGFAIYLDEKQTPEIPTEKSTPEKPKRGK